MNEYINYAIEANLGICVFLLVYILTLKNETNHLFNRAYLLVALVGALLLPLCHFQWPSAVTGIDLTARVLPAVMAPGNQNSGAGFFWFWCAMIYAVGAAISALVFLTRLGKMTTLIFQSPKSKADGCWVVEQSESADVFSFFNVVFIGNSAGLTTKERAQILRHERWHMDHLHSLDILLINLIGIVFWFNPFIKIYRNSFVQLHEFEADARSVDNEEVDDYCSLLARAALITSGYPLANHFTNSLTIKRILMMKTVKTKIKKWKLFVALGAALAFALAISTDNRVVAQDGQGQDKVYDTVDELAHYGTGDGWSSLYEYVAKNLRYPADAKKKGVEGKVYSQFVVERDGSLSDVHVTKGIGSGCDEEVVRLLSGMPKWKPGEIAGKPVRMKLVLPVIFAMDKKKPG